MWIAAAPPNGIPLSQSGHVEHAAVAPSPRTYAPESIRTKVPAAAPTASQVNALGFARPAPVAGQRRITAYTGGTARSSSAFARGMVTHGAGGSSRTVSAPRIAW